MTRIALFCNLTNEFIVVFRSISPPFLNGGYATPKLCTKYFFYFCNFFNKKIKHRCISIVGVKPWIDPDICATDIFYFKKIHICLQIFQGDVICVVVNGKHI